MKIYTKGSSRLVLTRYGIVIQYLRPSVKGGTYVRDYQMIAWPWRRVS